MASVPRVVREVPASPQLPFNFGRFSLSDWQIPYFSTTMSIEDLASSLHLVSDFPGSESVEWSIDELFQRDLDWKRVQQKIVPYLRSSEQAQFFSSLTIALLPVHEQRMSGNFEEQAGTPPQLNSAEMFSHTVTIGPVVCGYYNSWREVTDDAALIGQIRWNTDQVFGVAIDGQHRLAAVKELARGLRFSDKARQTRIPVVLLVLAEKVGYKAPSGTGLISVLRKLFIDLNKHAKAVSRSRQILLDDDDPHALCVRALVGKKVSAGMTELSDTPPRLPLSVVDWHREQAKFDDGPYLTTILGLDWMVSELLGSKPLADYADHDKVAKVLKSISMNLAIDLCSDESPTRRRLNDLQLSGRPFSFTGSYDREDGPTGELGDITNAFTRIWGAPLVRLLTEFTPYAKLLRLRKADDTFEVEFINWYFLYHRSQRDTVQGRAREEYRAALDRLENRERDPIHEPTLIQALEGIETAKQGNLAFNVVFQRAMILALREFTKVESADEDEVTLADDDDVEDLLNDQQDSPDQPTDGVTQRAEEVKTRSNEFLEALNELYRQEQGFLTADFEIDDPEEEDTTHRLWGGSLLSSLGNIDFTQAASRRAMEVILWIPILWLLREEGSACTKEGFDEFWENIDDFDEAPVRRLRRSIDRFAKDTGAGGKILAQMEEDYDAASAREHARIRIGWMWQQLGI